MLFRSENKVYDPKAPGKQRTVTRAVPLSLVGSDVRADLRSEPRRKGLLWYRTYKVAFQGVYRFDTSAYPRS